MYSKVSIISAGLIVNLTIFPFHSPPQKISDFCHTLLLNCLIYPASWNHEIITIEKTSKSHFFFSFLIFLLSTDLPLFKIDTTNITRIMVFIHVIQLYCSIICISVISQQTQDVESMLVHCIQHRTSVEPTFFVTLIYLFSEISK